MDRVKEFMLEAFIVLLAVGLYFLLPRVFMLIASYSMGVEGIVFQLAISLVLTGLYYLMGYRKKRLVMVFLLIVFVCAMIWLYFNYRQLDEIIATQYGQGVATGVFAAIILLVWLFGKILI